MKLKIFICTKYVCTKYVYTNEDIISSEIVNVLGMTLLVFATRMYCDFITKIFVYDFSCYGK